jgi:effector-binding domain-containing protein
MSYTCEVRPLTSQPTVAVRTRTSIENLSSVIEQVYNEIREYLGTPEGEYPDTLAYVAYHNMDMQDMDVEIGYVVHEPMPGAARIQPSKIINGEYAVCLHVGPYNELPKTYDTVFQWIGEHGLKSTYPNYEFYLNGPAEVESDDELKTEVAVHLDKTG